MGNWQRVRIAAEYEPEVDLAPEPAAEQLLVGRIAIGGSYGEFAEDPLSPLRNSKVPLRCHTYAVSEIL